MFWICLIFGLILGSFFGVVAYCNIEGVKGVIVGIIVMLVFGLIFGGGCYLDDEMRADKWNGGYCPDCNVHWTPYGASDSDLGSKHKYYYCEECYREIEL